MRVKTFSLQEYVDVIGEFKIDSVSQLPQYYQIREVIHPGEYRLEP